MSLRSPTFQRRIAAGLAAGSTDFKDYSVDFETGGSTPFNYLIIQNFSNQRISVSYGDKSDIIIRPNTNYEDEEAYGLKSLAIKNIDSAATSDFIQVLVSKTVSVRDAQIAALLKIPVDIVSRGDW